MTAMDPGEIDELRESVEKLNDRLARRAKEAVPDPEVGRALEKLHDELRHTQIYLIKQPDYQPPQRLQTGQTSIMTS